MDLLFFSSPIGLGHATRDSAVAACLGDVTSRFVTGGAAAEILSACGLDVDDLYDPPGFDVRDGRLHGTARWLWRYYRYYADCRGIARDAIERHGPRLVVSDEDFASLAVAQDMGVRTVLITDILETRFTSGPAGIIEKRMNRAMRGIMGRCDAVVLPEPGRSSGNTVRTGPIVRDTARSRGEIRAAYGFERKTILVSVGGTDAGRFLIRKALDVAPHISDVADMVLASGPSIRACGTVRDLGFVPNLHEIVFASDVVVSLAGKSTIDEANAYGTPGVFIPIRGHFEQEENAADEGFAYGDLDRLEEIIRDRLGRRRRPVASGGAQAACGVIHDVLGRSN